LIVICIELVNNGLSDLDVVDINCELQCWLFAISGEKLTMRIREMAFRAMLRQVRLVVHVQF